MIYSSNYFSPIGNLTAVSNGLSLTALQFENSRYFDLYVPKKSESKCDDIISLTFKWLDIYFSGLKPDFTPPLSYSATDFQKRVWDILLTVEYGTVITYKQIAEIIANERSISSMSAQAVGSAVGKNPIHIIIPCHRVVGSDGKLIGFAAGTDKKSSLLTLEGIDYFK